jgi:hypothetical protein
LQSAILISQYGKMMEEKYLTKFEVNSWEIYGKHNQ